MSLAGCGGSNEFSGQTEDKFAQLTDGEKAYIERFNVAAKDISDFPKAGYNLEDYFYVFKSVSDLADAEFLLFGENHTHSLNKLWSAAAMNKLIKPNDVVLFEGAEADRKIFQRDPAEKVISGIFATREYERHKGFKEYKPTDISNVEIEYTPLFFRLQRFLKLDILNLDEGIGKFWDLLEDGKLSNDTAKRNEAMVRTMQNNVAPGKRVFVVAGAMHLPQYEFGNAISFWTTYSSMTLKRFKAKTGFAHNILSDLYYDFCDSERNTNPSIGEFGTTRAIFDFLKDKNFAIIIPKNLPNVKDLEPFFPKNVTNS